MANTNRTKGHNAERLYAKVFQNLGFSHCITSRYGSRVHDDAGIDLINLPMNVQIKAGKQRGMNISTLISDIKGAIVKLFPPDAPEHKRPLIVIHRMELKRGKRRAEEHDVVHMSFEDFKKLINMITWE
jgi:hypothetical protein